MLYAKKKEKEEEGEDYDDSISDDNNEGDEILFVLHSVLSSDRYTLQFESGSNMLSACASGWLAR